MDIHAAQRELHTQRLWLHNGHEGLAEAVCDFHLRNRAHLLPWDPPTPPDFYTVARQAERVRQAIANFNDGTGLRYWIATRHDRGRVIGTVNINQVSRGAFHSAMLGYSLDATLQGQGLMHEALTAAIAEAFSPRFNLHRIQAAYQPNNLRSGAVLERLGFEHEGLARDYLFINGAWRDHCITALRNPAFFRPSTW